MGSNVFPPQTTNRIVAGSAITLCVIEGRVAQAERFDDFWNGKRAILMRIRWGSSRLATVSVASISRRKALQLIGSRWTGVGMTSASVADGQFHKSKTPRRCARRGPATRHTCCCRFPRRTPTQVMRNSR